MIKSFQLHSLALLVVSRSLPVAVDDKKVAVYFGFRKLMVRKVSIEKKNIFFRALPKLWGGGLPMPEFFGPLFRSAFFVNKKSLFLQKCQCIELLTVF